MTVMSLLYPRIISAKDLWSRSVINTKYNNELLNIFFVPILTIKL